MARKFTIFALFYLVFDAKSGRDLTEGFFALQFLGAYTWRGLFSEFYSSCCTVQ